MLALTTYIHNIERTLMERRDELRAWLDWALRGILVAILGFSISYWKSIATDISSMSTAIIEMKSENRRLADRLEAQARETQIRIEQLGNRVDRLENQSFTHRR